MASLKLCVFQGTFNPIHNAHLDICEYLKRNSFCEKILFIPAYKPPHKDTAPDILRHRLNMVKIATEDIEYAEVSSVEYEREEISYTLDTIKELYKKYDVDGRINFIIGTDAFEKIETWYKTDELKELVDFVLFLREDKTSFEKAKIENPALAVRGYNYKLMDLPFNDISSSYIRERVGQNLAITGLVPQKVEDYIKENELYKS